jgi:exopolyphosphatase / guanosine-5'-triphosphate,3'-diphosphate pyrophosphatase
VNVTVLELGSSSFQLLQARRTEAGRVEPLHAEKRYLQLASYSSAQGGLSAEGIELACRALRELLAAAPPSAHAGPVVAIATGTVRDALNSGELSRALAAEAPLQFRALSGEEEAQLTYLGAVSELGANTQNLAVVDLGGATTAIAWGTGDQIKKAASVRLGVLTLAERLAQQQPRGQMALEQMAVYVRRTFEPVLVVDEALRPQTLIFASGVAKTLLSLVYSYGLIFKGNIVPTQALHALVPQLLAASSSDLAQRGVAAPRLQSVGPTAVVFSVIADLFEVERFAVGLNGLREGVVLSAESVGLQPWPATKS